MRGLTLATIVIIFCFSVEMFNTIEVMHFNETNETLTGWNPTENPPITYTNLPHVGSQSALNETMREISSPAEQPWWEQVIDTAWAMIKLTTYFISLVINVLINSTLGFFTFIQTLGRSGETIVPIYIAGPIATLVYINYLLMVGQILTKTNMRGGA